MTSTSLPTSRAFVARDLPGQFELKQLSRQVSSLASAFQPNLEIQGIAAQMATSNWAKAFPALGFGSRLTGLEAQRAVEALASHQVSVMLRSVDRIKRASLFRVATNAERSLAGLGMSAARLSEAWKAAEQAIQPLRSLRGFFDEWTETVANLVEHQRDVDERTDEFVRRHGWPLPLVLTPRTYGRIVRLADQGKREVSSVMQTLFEPGTPAFKSCTEVLLGRSVLESRRPVLRQALKAHRRYDHYLVINALLPLVEGVLVDALFAAQEELPEGGRARKAIERLRENDGDDPIVGALELLVVAGAAGMGLFRTSNPADYGGKGEPRGLNRHAILHGLARRYGSRTNALKIILLLTVIAEVVDLHGTSQAAA